MNEEIEEFWKMITNIYIRFAFIERLIRFLNLWLISWDNKDII